MHWFKCAWVILLVSLFLLHAASGPVAADESPMDLCGEAMIADFVVLRPLGMVATAGGCAFFVATLPFTVWTKKRIKNAAHHLVAVPAT